MRLAIRLSLMKGDEAVEGGQRLADSVLLGERWESHVGIADGTLRDGDNLDSLHQGEQLVVERRRVEIVAKITLCELVHRPASYRVQPRDDTLAATSPQLRAFADGLILCRVGDDHVTVCEAMAGQSLCQTIIGNPWQSITICINYLAELHEDIAVVDIERMALRLAQFGT